MGRLTVVSMSDSEIPSLAVLDCLSDLAMVCSVDLTRVDYLNFKGRELTGWNWEGPQPSLEHRELIQPCSLPSFIELARHLTFDRVECSEVDVELRNIVGSSIPIQFHSVLSSPTRRVLLGRCMAGEETVDEVLRQTQARFRSIVDSLSVNLILKDTEGRVVYVNEHCLETNGWNLVEVLGKTDFDLFPQSLASKYSQDDRSVLETGQILHQLEENRKVDGSPYWVEVIKGPLRDADDRIAGIQILFWDATDRQLTEQALKLERHLLHTLLENVPDSIYFKDRESRFTRISRSMLEKFRFADYPSVLGKTDADIFTSEHADQARQDEVRIMETGTPLIGQIERETWPDRADTWCFTTKLPLRDPGGAIVGTFGIGRDVTELVQSQQSLREARDAADQANRAKSEFLANMSHEIRTPMNGIIGMTELLAHSKLNEAQRSFVEMIELSAKSLMRIINDILDFSKIEAGKLDLEQAPFDLRRCVSHAAKSLATRAAQQGTELVLVLEPEIPELVLGDEIRLRQVLVNLVGNAVKFTKGGEIRVRVSVANGPPVSETYSLHFTVSDTGIGIPPDKQTKIFEAFAQADVSTNRQYGGTGLGLSISSQLVALMGGKIWLTSEVGVGSEFHFTAPFGVVSMTTSESVVRVRDTCLLIVDDHAPSRQTLAESLRRLGMIVCDTDCEEEALQIIERFSHLATQPIVVLVDQIMPQIDSLDLVTKLRAKCSKHLLLPILHTTASNPITEQQMERYGIAGLLQKPSLAYEVCRTIEQILAKRDTHPLSKTNDVSVSKVAATSLNFLLAEDGAVNRAVFLGLLAERGHSVICVENGEAAVEAWQEFEFDAIFMDVQMPILDGLEATRRIRQLEPSGKHIPIIAITAGAMNEDHKKCLEAGMDDYLSKPIDFGQFQSVLSTLEGNGSNVSLEELDTSTDTASSSDLLSLNRSLSFDAPIRNMKCTHSQRCDLLRTLKQEAAQRLEEITQAINSQDDRLLVRASHSLKSAAALFEADAVSSTSALMEQAARGGDTRTAQSHFEDLRRATLLMNQEIADWLQAHSD